MDETDILVDDLEPLSLEDEEKLEFEGMPNLTFNVL